MSLRQRTQRPSESTNEGGHNGGTGTPRPRPPPPAPRPAHPPVAPSSGASGGGRRSAPYLGYGSGNGTAGGYQTPQPGMQRSKSSSAGYSGGGGGGYYSSAGYPSNNPATPGAPAVGYAGYCSPPAQAPYPTTAPPAYGYAGRGLDRSVNSLPHPSPSAKPRVLQFDDGRAVGSLKGAGGYRGPYAGNGSTHRGTNGNATGVANPYHSSKSSSSGFTFKHVLISLFAITFLTLTGTTIYFRSVLKRNERELREAEELVRSHMQEEDAGRPYGGRFDRAGGVSERGGHEGRRQAAERRNRSKPKPGDVEEKLALKEEVRTLREEIKASMDSHAEMTARRADRAETLEGLEGRKQDLLKKIDHMKNQLDDAVEQTAMYKAMVDGAGEVEAYMKKREGVLWNRIDALEGRIARESRREAEEWFGPGPHRVEIELEYSKVQLTNPNASSWPRIRSKVVIELAPLDLMPHTVNLFMQQVHHGLWDKCSLISSAHHIFQLGPSYDNDKKPEPMIGEATDVPNVGEDPRDDPGDQHYDHFHAKGLDKVSFQEYSDKFPHVQWTVGLAGRPGGPDFYINKIDNSLIHGPGGQINRHDLHNEADPCFGKIALESLDTLKELDSIPTDPDRGHELTTPVVILNARVAVPMENPADGWRKVERGTKLLTDDEIMPLPEVPHGV